MEEEKLRRNVYRAILLIVGGFLVYLAVRYLLLLLLPFLLAWGTALLCTRPAERLCGNKPVTLKFCRTLFTLALLAGGGALLGYLVARLCGEGWRFLSDWLEGDRLAETVSFLLRPFRRLSAAGLGSALTDSLSGVLSGALAGLAGWLSSAVRAVPQIFLFSLVTLVSAVYFAWGLEEIHAFVRRVAPARVAASLSSLRTGVFGSIGKVVRSYFILMCITFGVITLGLLLLQVEYALLLGIVIALLDALPVIGVGTVLVPWSVYQLFFGQTRLGIGLLVLYAAHEVLRQFLEPRIVGKSLGIHPLLTLLLLYVGYSLFGIVGLLLLPLLTVILQLLLRKLPPASAPAPARRENGEPEK